MTKQNPRRPTQADTLRTLDKTLLPSWRIPTPHCKTLIVVSLLALRWMAHVYMKPRRTVQQGLPTPEENRGVSARMTCLDWKGQKKQPECMQPPAF